MFILLCGSNLSQSFNGFTHYSTPIRQMDGFGAEQSWYICIYIVYMEGEIQLTNLDGWQYSLALNEAILE